MRMRIAAIYFELPINMPTEPIVRNHPAHGAFDKQFGMASTARPDTLRFVAADVTRETHIIFLFFLLAGEPNLFRVDDNNKISGVDVWRENRFLFATQQSGSLHGDAAEHLVLGVNDPPLARHFAGFGGKRFHSRKKSTETTGDGGACQPT
jgi:hypothetical protein